MSEKYDYEKAMAEDIRQWLEESGEYNGGISPSDRDAIYDELFVNDSVTGNASGSYTCNAWKAEEYVCHNLDLLGEALDEFCVDGETLRKKMSGEWADVTIRCYMLGRVLNKVIDEWNKAHGSDDDED